MGDSHGTANEDNGPERGFESEILRLEREVGGLGRISLDPATGKVVLYLTDTATAPHAVATLRTLAPNVNVLPSIREKLGRREHMLIRRGFYSFSRLLEGKRQIAVRRVSGLVSLDANEGENLIDVGVLPSRSPQLVLEELRNAGVPASAVRIRHPEPATDLGGNLWGRYRPASAGLQIEAGGGCTLGLAVTVVNYNPIGYLTAAHCQAMPGQGQLGTKIYQPYNDGTNGNWLATVSLNPAWNRTDPECQTTLCSYADVMFAEHNAAAGSFIKRVVATFDWNQHVNDNMYGDILFGSSGWGGFQVVPYVVQGSLVYKVGKTTGITAGYVTKTCDLGITSHKGVVHTVLCVDAQPGRLPARVTAEGPSSTRRRNRIHRMPSGSSPAPGMGLSWLIPTRLLIHAAWETAALSLPNGLPSKRTSAGMSRRDLVRQDA